MVRFVIEKIISGILTLFGVATVVFFLFNVLPGDPAQMVLDQNATEQQFLKVKKKYGFDLPIGTQYLLYLNDLSPLSFHSKEPDAFSFYKKDQFGGYRILSFSKVDVIFKVPYLRTSYQRQGKNVGTIITETLPNTMVLAAASIGIAIIFGFFFI